MNRVILASASPRRKEILQQAGMHFEVLSLEHKEHSDCRKPEDLVKDLATQKAKAAFSVAADLKNQNKNLVVIGADTVVVLEDRILGKPKDRDDAFLMVSSLQGKSHCVLTGVCVTALLEDGSREQFCFMESTWVQVCKMTLEEMKNYIKTDEPMDKAGGYAIQGKFARYIQGIQGDYYNVMGFPLCRFYQEIKKRNNLCRILDNMSIPC